MKVKEKIPTIELFEKISKAVKRYVSVTNLQIDGFILSMDLENTLTEADIDRLLEFDDQNFIHDVYGISVNIDRRTGNFQNCFSPRCTSN